MTDLLSSSVRDEAAAGGKLLQSLVPRLLPDRGRHEAATLPRLAVALQRLGEARGAAVALQPELASVEDGHAACAGRTERSETAHKRIRG
jgi:hypothetical protein